MGGDPNPPSETFPVSLSSGFCLNPTGTDTQKHNIGTYNIRSNVFSVFDMSGNTSLFKPRFEIILLV